MRYACSIVCGLILVTAFGKGGYGQAAQARVSVAPLTAEQVVYRMQDKQRERAAALRQFEASRVYHLEYRGFGGNKEADMRIRMNYSAPANKSFIILSQQGSRFLIDRVFMKLLESEQEALEDQNRNSTALNADNYEFTLAGYDENSDGTHSYVLDVKPRTKSKFLYQGRIWVSAEDFAVIHIQAVPVKNPSFWIKKAEIEHTYIKVGDFWFPSKNRTESQIRLGGRALLTIDYENYRIISADPLGSSTHAGNTKRDSRSSQRVLVRQFGPSDAALADAITIPK